MYDRAPRTLTRPADSTGRNVGPGSYEAPEYIHSKYGMSLLHFSTLLTLLNYHISWINLQKGKGRKKLHMINGITETVVVLDKYMNSCSFSKILSELPSRKEHI